VNMNRDDADKLLKGYVRNERMLNHCCAAEAVMCSLARRLGEDDEKWGIAGLLHDIDIEVTGADLNLHCLEAEKILMSQGIDPEVIDAMLQISDRLGL